jgi:hypothetical protein
VLCKARTNLYSVKIIKCCKTQYLHLGAREFDEELDDFLDMAVEEKMKQGMTRSAALRAVRLEHGSAEMTREVVHTAQWESRNLWSGPAHRIPKTLELARLQHRRRAHPGSGHRSNHSDLHPD